MTIEPGARVFYKRNGHPPMHGEVIEILPRSHYGCVRIRWDDGHTSVMTRDSLNIEPITPRGPAGREKFAGTVMP